MPANPIPLNATARTWVATRVRRLEGPQLAPPSWQYAGQSHLQHSTARMEAMVFNDRFRCDAAYVLDGEGSERNGPGSKPGDADRQASRDEKGDRGPGHAGWQ